MNRRSSAASSGGSVRPDACALFAAALVLAGCAGPAPATFDLSAPREVTGAARIGGDQLIVTEPAALQTLDGNAIIVKSEGGAVSQLDGVQWADRLPKLVQTRLIQTFENGSRLGRVARPGEGVVANYALGSEIRRFEVSSTSSEAVVEISARLIETVSGRVVSAKIFSARVPVAGITGPGAARALDEALSSVLLQIVRWSPARV
ncbi:MULTISPECIES: ABC-type transport auxiliary lipoprotein family protein [unclassified Chelatococcus]|uniref:ABC-type transport auxiliary lipoprotein family protein n=1 Tax=unclassified Chelatococcus TaxID=2638111 RepID=UPI00031235DB|nr:MULTISPECIES: ABC-type transport auxiliary lipoprotein family protein [unclassified Chelatococcus]ALA16292.1 ABC transporter [Chelatococcus sp. CO-6]